MRKKVHVKKGDMVVVITGKDAGKKGKIIEVIPTNGKVVVEGINVAKRHTKPTQKLPQGGINDKAMPIDSSNVLLYCKKCDKGVRAGKKIMDNGKKIRVCKKCGEEID